MQFQDNSDLLEDFEFEKQTQEKKKIAFTEEEKSFGNSSSSGNIRRTPTPNTSPQSSTKETVVIKVAEDSFDPFRARWKTVNLSERITFHVYSAFYDDRRSEPLIRITAAIPLKQRVIFD